MIGDTQVFNHLLPKGKLSQKGAIYPGETLAMILIMVT